MARVGLYLGRRCPPNMEAYLDGWLAADERGAVDLVVRDDCPLPGWLREHAGVVVRRYDVAAGGGVRNVTATAATVRRYLREHDPDVVRQITQPRWHAPGVILGTARSDARVETRASSSMFAEFRGATDPVRSFLANNVLGRAVFLGDVLYTPRYGGVDPPWWSTCRLVVEPRRVNGDRFSPAAEPRTDLFGSGDRRVLAVGRVSRRKGMDRLADVASRLPDWRFAVVGERRDGELVRALETRENVRLHGPIPYVEMPGAYASADVLLSTSRLEWGGISRAMLEASAVGTPVVALDIEDAATVADVVVPDEPVHIARGLEEALEVAND